jgi:uncharacterized protein (TIRG00374 family)
MKNRFLLYFLCKIIVTALLVYWIMQNVAAHRIHQSIKQLSVFAIVASVISLFASYSLASYRWNIIMRQKENHPFPIRDCFYITSIGIFLNQGLPGSIGGDLYRVFAVGRYGFSKTWRIQGLLLDRIWGLISMAILALFSIFFFDAYIRDRLEMYPLYGLIAAVLFGFIVFTQLDRIPLSGRFKTLLSPLMTLSSSARSMCTWRRSGFILLGLLVIVLLYLPCLFLGDALHINLSFPMIAFVMPVVFLVSVLPISFAGWGVREVAFVKLLSLFSIPSDKALTVSLLYGLITLFSSFPGLFLWVFESFKKSAHLSANLKEIAE